MIDIDEIEKQAMFATGGEPIGVDRDELILLINRYRELPDLSQEERSQAAPIPGIRLDDGQADRSGSLVRKCRAELRTAKIDIEQLRYHFSLFADCPDCNVKAGADCRGQGHQARLNAAFAALSKLRGSSYCETV